MPFREKGTSAPTADAAAEELGTVTAPEGELILIDFGLLRLWSGRSAPAALSRVTFLGPLGHNVRHDVDSTRGHTGRA